MNIQQANFVKNLLQEPCSLNKIAEEFFKKFGSTEYCSGPKSFFYVKGKKVPQYSSLDGNDIKITAETYLNQRL